MIFKITTIILLGAVAASSAVPRARDIRVWSRPNHDHIDYYDCSGHPNGNYLHPWDCTRFISCSNEGASDMACADCDLNNFECAGNPYLVYNVTLDRCEWPLYTKCIHAPTSEPEPAPEPTEAPATTQGPPGNETTQGPPGDETTQGPPGDTPCPFKEGDPCGEEECRHCGYCVDKVSYYMRCNHTKPRNPHEVITGTIVIEQCGPNSWWNSELKPNGAEIGGSCDTWEGLDKSLQDKYNTDPDCNPPICEWGQDENCSPNYWYFDPKKHDAKKGERDDLSCQSGYVWHRKTETCRDRVEVGC